MSDDNAPVAPADMAIQALMKHWNTRSSGHILTAARGDYFVGGGTAEFIHEPKTVLPTLVMQTLFIPGGSTTDGTLIQAVTIPWKRILKLINDDPDLIYKIDPRKWEEIIAGSYQDSGLFDEVILTPQSGDHGRDVIATRHGFCSIRCIESVKRYTPGKVVTAEDVRSLGFAVMADPKVNKGVVSTSWEFAPRIEDDPNIKSLLPHRLELVNRNALIERFKTWSKLDSPTHQ